jgi:hypothetical protein
MTAMTGWLPSLSCLRYDEAVAKMGLMILYFDCGAMCRGSECQSRAGCGVPDDKAVDREFADA